MIRVGVAGWDYPDWKGPVYPVSPVGGFDRLSYISEFVDVVEVNSTFYRPIDPRTASSWVRRTERRPGFRFTAKAHRSWSHVARSNLSEVVPDTLHGLEPLREAGVLGALLIQFPQRFHREPENLERLGQVLDRVEDWPVVVEVRHESWDSDEAESILRARGIGWCVVDQPRVRGAAGASTRRTGEIGYLRLHGRNAADWFRAGAGRDERYDYLYSVPELTELAAVAHELAAGAEEVFVVQNNHFRGQAVVNSLQMKHMLDGTPPEAPPNLVRAYPALAESVRERQSRMF